MARLPGLGPRSARRAVLALLKKRGALMAPLAQAMAQVALDGARLRDLRQYRHRGYLRRSAPIRAVPPARSAWSRMSPTFGRWNAGGAFKGRYHVLGGTLSALDAMGPDELRIPRLVARVADEGVTEVILALNATVDGQTTAHYIADALARTRRADHLAGAGRADRRRAGLS